MYITSLIYFLYLYNENYILCFFAQYWTHSTIPDCPFVGPAHVVFVHTGQQTQAALFPRAHKQAALFIYLFIYYNITFT